MLISGRKDMEKSLKSLLPFKKAFPCEIILVDTGCNEQQRTIAEKYADKIIDFTWCGDFAMARNAGLGEAHGEWFMYLDDDEWFDNPQEIIAFFQSGDCKKYNSASYVVRNYLDFEGKAWVYSYPSRMVKIENGTKFIGKVHEYLDPFPQPLKKFNDFVHHYGYVYKNAQDKIKHAQRNIKPLLEMCKEYPGDPRWTFQLAQEYFALAEYDKVIHTCAEGIAEWEEYKGKISYCPIHVGTLFSYILISLEYLGKYEDEILWLNRAISHSLMELKTMEMSLAFYHMIGARLYAHLKNRGQSYLYFEKYIEAAKLLRDDRSAMEIETAGIVTDVFHSLFMSETVLLCLGTVIDKGNYILAEEAFGMVDWNEKILSFWPEWIEEILKACCNQPYNPLFGKIFQMLITTENSAPQTYTVLKKLEEKYRLQGETESLERLVELTIHLDSKHVYILSNKIKWLKMEKTDSLSNEDRAKAQELFKQLFIECPDQILDTDDEIWDIAEQLEIDMESRLLNIDFRVWRRALERMNERTGLEAWKKWNTRIKTWKRNNDIRYDIFKIKYDEVCLANYLTITPKYEQLEEMIWMYTDDVLNFYRPCYRDEALQTVTLLLPDDMQLALFLDKLRSDRKDNNVRGTLEKIKQCLGVYPKLDRAITAYAKMLRDNIEKDMQERDQAIEQMQDMARSLKDIAKIKMTENDYAMATTILQQLLQYIPEDREVKEMLEQCTRESNPA